MCGEFAVLAHELVAVATQLHERFVVFLTTHHLLVARLFHPRPIAQLREVDESVRSRQLGLAMRSAAIRAKVITTIQTATRRRNSLEVELLAEVANFRGI